jgi:HEAT repeat protein
MDDQKRLEVVRNRQETAAVRIRVLKQLRSGRLEPAVRSSVAHTIAEMALDDPDANFRLQAVLALAEFTDVSGVPSMLGELALDADESIELRYSAFTSLQRTGPTPECAALLRRLLTDETLGRSARSVLALWHLDEHAAGGGN